MTTNSIHWRTPLFMLGAFVAGVMLCLGHHLFNHRMNGTEPHTADYHIFHVSKQKIITTVGTAFAFGVKTSFAFSMSLAYTQLVWKSIKQQRTELAKLDALFSILSNAFLLADYSLWLKYPLILCMASSVWLIPIAAVVTPATLTVETIPVPHNYSMTIVPKVDFDALNFALLAVSPGDDYNALAYGGPEFSIGQVAVATATQGIILPVQPPHPNSSWWLDFAGPSVRCNSVEGSLRNEILGQIVDYNDAVSNSGEGGLLSYLGWTPSTGNLPFAQGHDNSFRSKGYTLGPAYFYSPGNYSTSPPADWFFNDISTYNVNEPWNGTASNLTGARIFVAVISSLGDYGNVPSLSSNTTLISCELYNASYRIEYEFVNGVQTAIVSIVESHEDIIALNGVSWGNDSNPFQSYYPNGSAIEKFDHRSHTFNGTYNSTIPRILAYQSVFDAFGQILVGSIVSGTKTNTSILNTVLLHTQEMAAVFIPSDPAIDTDFEFFLGISSDQNVTDILPAVPDPVLETVYLQDALEEVFHNITINLIASGNFYTNRTPQTNVTLHNYHTVYVYTAPTLWIAYGLASTTCLIVVVCGLLAMMSNDASYSDNFSTAVRASRHADLTVEIHSLDAGGQDPLPRYLAKSLMTFSKRRSSRYTGLEMDEVSAVALESFVNTTPTITDSVEETGSFRNGVRRRSTISLVSEQISRTSSHDVD